MQLRAITLAALGGLLLISGLPLGADTLIENVQGYTWRENGLHTFQALRFDQNGRIVATYDNATIPDAPTLQRIDGAGATLIPGLVDAHGHVLMLGHARTRADLVGTRSRAEAVARVADYARQNPDVPWILGRGWNQVLWQDNRFPQAADLDELAESRPIWLGRIDGHAAWANTAAMTAAGISNTTPDPHGGRILRDADGSATGVFVDAATALIDRVVPPPTADQDRRALSAALTELASVGLTSVHDAGIDLRTAKLYRELGAANRLPIRVYAMLSEEVYRDFGEPMTDDGTGFLAIQSVKVYLDGALGSRGAAMIEPYSDKPGEHGLLFKKTDQFAQLVGDASKRGFQVNAHAIGDAANQVALDGFAAKDARSELRHRIEHAQVIRISDIPRFAKLGVIASMQPTHAGSDKNMAKDRIGADRILGAYAWRTLLDTGAVLAAGSDFPVEPAEPLYGLHAAVTRQDRNDMPAGGWYKDQALQMDEALRVFTLDAAYAARQENQLGTLEPGKRADFVLLDENIFKIPAREIWRAKVRETWVNGVCIYRAED
ncbi:MAG: amidohydrolase [Gammaproteobacteria bacterium]|nr:amidohydrolase [Gammaproteobacteria bacterium]